MRVKLVFEDDKPKSPIEYEGVHSFSYCGSTGEALVKFGPRSEAQHSDVHMVHTYDE